MKNDKTVKDIMKKLHIGIILSMVVVSCGLFESNDNGGISDKVYVPLRILDQVAIVDVGSGKIDFVDINYNDIGNEPHFVVIDEINRYWFVTTIKSGYVGCYNLDTDELIDTILVGDSPALMVLNEEDKKLYVSRMMPMGMPMGTMMMGAVSTIVQEINYKDSSHMVLSNEFELSSPAPHGLAINTDGSELYVTSNTADWLYKVNSETGDSLSASMDSLINYIDPSIEVKRLKPIQCISLKDSLLLISCSGGIHTDPWMGEQDTIFGQVQLWNTNTMSLKDMVQFSWKSRPWHIINSPLNDEVFVALGGDVIYPGSAGVACLTYTSDTLAIKWETYSHDFEGLHGIDVSENGESLFVSGREDGNLHIFNVDSGEKIKSIPLGNNPVAQGVTAVYK